MENKYRNFFHIEPEKGLLNDPNGLIQFKGKYYFFFQWNRFNTNHSYKEWGLFTSKNLINWKNIGSAILPDSKHDKNGVYSGSAIEYNEALHIFYTGNTLNNKQRKSYIKHAISTDGEIFVKQEEKLEVPTGYTEHFRDPKVWQDGKKWMMIVGAQTLNNEGRLLLFSSSDLIKWDFINEFFNEESLNQMAECPDYFQIDEDTEILTVSPQKRTNYQETDVPISSYSGYIKGYHDKEKHVFIPETDIQIIDYGFDFYAPQSFFDDKNRRIMVAWMSRMNDKQEELAPSINDHYLHCLTMPRQLIWKNNHLYQIPLKEFEELRKEKIELNHSLKIENHINSPSKAYELIITLDQIPDNFSIELNSNKIYFERGKLIISRLSWINREKESKEIVIDNVKKLHLFCDTSTMELFINDGEYVFSMRYFNTEDDNTIKFEGFSEKDSITYYSY